MNEIEQFRKIIKRTTEQLEDDGHYDMTVELNLFSGSLITTIESLQNQFNTAKAEAERLWNIEDIAQEYAEKVQSQKEEIKRQREAIEESLEWISPSSYAYELLKKSLQEGDKT